MVTTTRGRKLFNECLLYSVSFHASVSCNVNGEWGGTSTVLQTNPQVSEDLIVQKQVDS